MIHAHSIGYQHHGRTLFDAASFRFDIPEFVAVIGPNGAGKSTLLKLLSGIQPPTSGKVMLDGVELSQWSVRDLARRRACLQQHTSVFESFSVAEVLAMGRYVHSDARLSSEDHHLLEATLRELKLEQAKDRVFNSLSGGEQQRIQFSRTLLQLKDTGSDDMSGKMLFLDEPLNNLDLHYQYGLLEQARRAVVDKGGSVIAVLHDLNAVDRFADRVIVLSEGKTILDAPTKEVMNPSVLSAVFGVRIERIETAGSGTCFVVTQLLANTAEKQASFSGQFKK